MIDYFPMRFKSTPFFPTIILNFSRSTRGFIPKLYTLGDLNLFSLYLFKIFGSIDFWTALSFEFVVPVVEVVEEEEVEDELYCWRILPYLFGYPLSKFFSLIKNRYFSSSLSHSYNLVFISSVKCKYCFNLGTKKAFHFKTFAFLQIKLHSNTQSAVFTYFRHYLKSYSFSTLDLKDSFLGTNLYSYLPL